MSNQAAKLTIEDILANPNKYGAPTFEQFLSNKAKWTKRSDDSMITLTDGPEKFRKDLKKIKFFIHGVELSGEDAVERALGDHGFSLEDIDLTNRGSALKKEIMMKPVGGGLEHEVHVNFLP